MAERSFVSEHVTTANPWDVFEMLTDQEQQAQWRAKFEAHAPVYEATPYTRVVFEDRLIVELEPEGTGTLLRGTRVQIADGPLGGIGLRFASRRNAEADLHNQLVRIASTLEYGGI